MYFHTLFFNVKKISSAWGHIVMEDNFHHTRKHNTLVNHNSDIKSHNYGLKSLIILTLSFFKKLFL